MVNNKKRFDLGLGIGFWSGMGVMSLINFLGLTFINYRPARYSLVMFFISIIMVIIGIIFWKYKIKQSKKSK